jgi:hypothetical protein
MFAEPGITVAGHMVTSFQLLITGALLLCAAAILRGYRRETPRQSAVTDRFAEDLSRIANALERMANRPGGFSIRAAEKRGRPAGSAPDAEPASEEAHRVAYSIFGR